MGCFGDSITSGLVATWRTIFATLFGTFYKKQIRWSGWNVGGGATSGVMIGASGITLETLITSPYATAACLNNLALDVAIIHIGSNDATAGRTAASVRADMNTLLDRLRAANPACIVLLSLLTPNTNATPDANCVLFNTEYVDLKATRSDGAFIENPDPRTAFLANASWATELMADSIHPNNAGSALQGQTYYNKIITRF